MKPDTQAADVVTAEMVDAAVNAWYEGVPMRALLIASGLPAEVARLREQACDWERRARTFMQSEKDLLAVVAERDTLLAANESLAKDAEALRKQNEGLEQRLRLAEKGAERWRHFIEKSRACGGYRKGEKIESSKLTELDVIAIRSEKRSHAEKRALAAEHGVTVQCIRDICSGKTWAYLLPNAAALAASEERTP